MDINMTHTGQAGLPAQTETYTFFEDENLLALYIEGLLVSRPKCD